MSKPNRASRKMRKIVVGAPYVTPEESLARAFKKIEDERLQKIKPRNGVIIDDGATFDNVISVRKNPKYKKGT